MNLPVPHLFVGDGAFPLSFNLLKPFQGSNLTARQRIFNYRLSRCRRIIENCFGILVSRFKVLSKPLNHPPNNAKLIVLCCCILHNFLIEINGESYLNINEEDDENLSNFNLLGQESNNEQRNVYSVDLRERLMNYFISDGSVDYQYRMTNLI